MREHDGNDLRPRKKQRLSQTDDQQRTKQHHQSVIWQPFRALGIVTNQVPFAYQSLASKHLRKPEFSFATCTGNSFGVWAEEAMRLKFVGEQLPQPISSLANADNKVLAASGPSIHVFERGKIVAELKQSDADNLVDLSEILVLGDQAHALSADGKQLLVWTISTTELYTTITFPSNFTATHMLHPDTYLNKVVVSSEQGELALWNTQTGTCIHTFTPTDILPFEKPSPIRSLAQSPAVDVLAIGHASGTVAIYDIRQGQLLFSVKMDLVPQKHVPLAHSQNRGVTSISFRTDNVAHTLATGSSDGNIAVWDLDTGPDASLTPGRLLHILKLAHLSPISRVQFLPGQPILVSAAGDNALKQWLFDSPTGPPRLLRERSGHTGPPVLIRHYGADGKQLLSAGGSTDRTLRLTSLVRDSRSAELAQTHDKSGRYGVDSRLPPVATLSWNSARSKEWDDLVTVHTGESVARTWSVQNKRQGQHTLDASLFAARSNQGKKYKKAIGTAKAVCISTCGNFVFAGYSNSPEIGMWNMQSGVQRKTFILPPATTQSPLSYHVSGLATDALNKILVAATLDGYLHFFDFHNTVLAASVAIGAGIKHLVLNRDNNLLALNCEDAVVRIVDTETRRVVREIVVGTSQILDMSFSHDSRWIVTTSQDKILRTYDLPTGNLIDAFRTPSTAVSITFSPTGDFLATAHLNSVGIFLWANKAQFTEVSLKSFANMPITSLSLPGVQGEDDEDERSDDDTKELVDETDQLNPTNQHFGENMATLSVHPRSKWQTLLNLDAIRLRNKPVEPPRAPERAPFFLPSVAGLEQRFDVQTASNAHASDTNGHLDITTAEVNSVVMQTLRDGTEDDYAHFFAVLVDMPTAAMDSEIRSLSPDLLPTFIQAMTKRLEAHRDFEAVQAILGVFLRVQADAIILDPDLQSDLQELLQMQQQEANRINQLIGFCQGALSFVRNVPIV